MIEALIDAAKSGDEPRVRAIVVSDPALAAGRLPSGESPLMAALYRGHTGVVATLIELGADLDLFASAATGHVEGLRRALETADPVNAYAYDGWTPLHLAAFFGRLDAARVLLDAGADPHAISRNSLRNTPLHAAAAGRHEAVARLLLDRGADPHAVDAGGYTPSAIALENGIALEDR